MRYRSVMADSARWDDFELRSDDIVISTPPKCGTTWTQMLCALLIFDGPEFPEPLNRLTPWLDQCTRPVDAVYATYAAQRHRRFIKTHTPLDGLPVVDGVNYLVVGRDPRDVMMSMDDHMANMHIDRVLELRAEAVGLDDLGDLPRPPELSTDPSERFGQFLSDPGDATLALPAILHHLDTAWQRRHDGNVALFHYADYAADLPGEMLRLAGVLGIDLSASRARELAPEASFERMRDRSAEVTPSADSGFWKDRREFFHAGGLGRWREVLTADDLARYDEVVAELVGPQLAAWVNDGRIASGVDPEIV